MDHCSTKYILLSTSSETEQEVNSLTAGIWGVLSGYVPIFGGRSGETEISSQILRGELLQTLPSNEKTDESGKIYLAGIKQKYLRAECFESQLAKLSEEETQLLLAVQSYSARCLMVEQQLLPRLLTIGERSQVYVYHKELNRYLAAFIHYKGAVSPYDGVMFGVQIVDSKYRHQGICDGTFRCKRYFNCAPGSGMFVSADKIKVSLEQDSSSSVVAIQHTDEESEQLDPSSDTEEEYEHLKEEPCIPSVEDLETSRDEVEPTKQEQKPVDPLGVGEHSGARHCVVDGNKLRKKELVQISEKEEYWKNKVKYLEGLLYEETAKTVTLQEEVKHLRNSLQQEQNTKLFLEKSLAEEKHNLGEQRKCFTRECEEFEKRVLEERGTRTKLEKELEKLQMDARKRQVAANVALQLQQERENHLQQEIDITKCEQEEIRRQLQEAEERLRTVSVEAPVERRQDWIISRDEVHVGNCQVGIGGWGLVTDGKFRGCDVAVKQIHALILSPHNRRLFEREMTIAAQCRHPCLLQFIGATNDDGSPLFITELLDTNLRTLLEERPLKEEEIVTIAVDVARALNYLHLHKPSPIIHRDISSANVLLWRHGESWRAKVSDYGAANFMRQCKTVNPGCVTYAAPEALSSKQSPKIDVYSFGLLLCEMCNRELPVRELVSGQIAAVASQMLRDLIRRCVKQEPVERPSMMEIIKEFEELASSVK